MDAVAESGTFEWSPRVSTINRFSLGVDNERVVSRETGSAFSGTNGDGGNFIFPVQLTTSRVDHHTGWCPVL